MLGFHPLLLQIPPKRRNLSLWSSILSRILIAMMILILFIPLSNGSPLLTCQYFSFSLILILVLLLMGLLISPFFLFFFSRLLLLGFVLSVYFFKFVCLFLSLSLPLFLFFGDQLLEKQDDLTFNQGLRSLTMIKLSYLNWVYVFAQKNPFPFAYDSPTTSLNFVSWSWKLRISMPPEIQEFYLFTKHGVSAAVLPPGFSSYR